jgi:hypothetical protein
MMTDEQIKMGIAGAFNGQAADRQAGLFWFVKGVIADRDKEIVELRSAAEWARRAYKAVAFAEGVRPLGMAGLLEEAPAIVKGEE